MMTSVHCTLLLLINYHARVGELIIKYQLPRSHEFLHRFVCDLFSPLLVSCNQGLKCIN